MASFDKMHNRNQEATVWVGGIEPQCTEEIVWELMVQCGPVVDVTMPRDKVTGTHQGYAFCEFGSREDADYCIRIMNMIKLYGKHLRVNKAAKDTKEQEWFANLFVGNLSLEVDEKMLYDTFSQFGAVLSAKIMSKPETPETRRFAFVTFDSFESSDAAIQAMNGQFLHNQAIHVSYAYKKDGSKGEKHGTPAERVLAKKQQQQFKVLRPPPLSSLSMMGRMSLPALPMGLGALPPRPPPMGGTRGGGPGLGAPGAPRPPPPPTGSGRHSNPPSNTQTLPPAPPETKTTPSTTTSSSSSSLSSSSSSSSTSSTQTTSQPPPFLRRCLGILLYQLNNLLISVALA